MAQMLRIIFMHLALSAVVLTASVSVCAQTTPANSPDTEAVPSRAELKKLKSHLKRGEKHIRKGRFDRASAEINLALKIAPRNVESRLLQARLALKQKNLIKAYDVAYSLALEDERNDRALSILGTVALNAGIE